MGVEKIGNIQLNTLPQERKLHLNKSTKDRTSTICSDMLSTLIVPLQVLNRAPSSYPRIFSDVTKKWRDRRNFLEP